MKKCLILMAVLLAGCAHRSVVKELPEEPSLLESSQNFYAFIMKREIGIWHNDQAEEFTVFFKDTDSYYDFMDSFIYILRQRNIYRNTVTHFFILGYEFSEDGDSATVNVKLLSRDAYMLYRKIDATHQWIRSEGRWYPGKIEAPERNWFTKYTQMYGLPPWF